jgi:hypothetical protein
MGVKLNDSETKQDLNKTRMSMHILWWSGVSVASTMWTLPIYIFPTTIVIFTNIRANLEEGGGTPRIENPPRRKQ